jgi:ADP-ribose pyrophosphatase
VNEKVEKWKMLSRKELLNHPRMHVVEDEVELPDGSKASYVRMAPGSMGSATVIAINDADEILLQREYSYPPDEVMWQLPGGGILDGEDVIAAAKRELAEESGYSGSDAEVIGSFYMNNRRSEIRQYVVVIRGLSETKRDSDPEEIIENHWVYEGDVRRMIREGECVNAYMLAALNIWFQSQMVQ